MDATAGGTLALAIFTAALAWSTRRLASEAGAERRANWQPVLVPHVEKGAGGIAVAGLCLEDGTLSMRVRNVGRGPALKVSAAIWRAGIDSPIGDTRRGHAPTNVVANGEDVTFEWRDFDPPLPTAAAGIGAWSLVEGMITYGDVGDRRHDTEVKIGFRIDRAVSLIDHQFLGAERDRVTRSARARYRTFLWSVELEKRLPSPFRRLAHGLARRALRRSARTSGPGSR